MVLSAFNQSRRPLSLSDVARISGVEKSATQRVLYTLRTLGYLRQSADTRYYSFSARMLEFGTAFLASDRLHELAAPILQSVNQDYEETVNLTEREGNEVVYVLRYPSRHVVSVDLSLGSRLPVYCTAPGRAMLAHMEESEIHEVLATSNLVARTPNTLTDKDAVLRSLEETRRKGYCLTNQEAFIGDISVSSPVFDRDGKVVAAINIAVPWPRWPLDKVERELAPVVMGAASAVTAAMSRQ